MTYKIFTDDYMSLLEERFKDNTLIDFFSDGIFYDPEEETMDYDFDCVDDNIVLNLDDNYVMENAIKLYETYKLTRIQASNRGFWTYLSLHKFAEYNKKKFPINEKNVTSTNTVHDHYLMKSNATSIMRHTLAGLWWAVYLSVDDQRADKYELTKVLFRQKTFYSRFFPTNIISIKEAVLGVLDFMKNNESLFEKYFEHRMRAVNIIVNRLAGTKLIATMDRDFFKKELEMRKGIIEKAISRPAILELF